MSALKSQPRTWRADDAVDKLIATDHGSDLSTEPHKIRQYKESIQNHRFSSELSLKVCARVVLLYNLDHERGLVNGSVGTVIGFAPAPRELEKSLELVGSHKKFRQQSMQNFQNLDSNSRMRPLVLFSGKTRPELISAMASSSLRGDSNPFEQYVATRTQVSLALAWALSIHKSQDMTLEYFEVSSKDIFESGQLYVALSRATHLDGLRLTGFKRNQLAMDQDVLRFYTETKWEQREPKEEGSAQVTDSDSST